MKQLILLATLAAVGSPALAQAERGDDIIVTGQRLPGDVQSAAHAMVTAITATTVSGQIARWTDPVCIRISGVTDDTAARVRTIMTAVAQDAGIAFATGDCDTNIMVTFTADADALAAVIAERQPRMLRTMPVAERAELLGGQRVLRWWYRTSVTSSRGSRPGSVSAALMNSGDYRVDSDAPTTNEYVSTMIRRPTNASIDGASIIVDMRHAQGMGLSGLAHYIAMVAFAQPRMTDDFAGIPSILASARLPAAERPALELTAWDRAFLSALYAVPADRSASAQRSLVAQSMAASLTLP